MEPSNFINICTWNARGLIGKQNTFEDFLFSQNIGICAVTETKYKGLSSQIYKNYNYIHKSDIFGRGGVALFSKRNIVYTEVDLNIQDNGLQFITGKYDINSKFSIYVICIYSHDDKDLTPNCLNNMVEQLPHDCNLIITGDFNAHHYLWGGNKIDTKGEIIETFITEKDMVLLNDGSFTRIGNANQNNSALDLTMVSPNLSLISDWEVLKDSIGSDHLPTLTAVQLNFNNRNNNREYYVEGRRNFKKANWSEFSSTIDTELKNFSLTGTPTEDYNNFLEILQQAAKKHIPIKNKKKNINHPYSHWWNEECSEVIRKRKEAMNKFLNNLNEENRIQANFWAAKARKVLKENKRKSWRNFCTKLNRNTNIGEVFKMAKSYRMGTDRVARECNANILDIDQYASHICPDYVPTEREVHNNKAVTLDNDEMHSKFTWEELTFVLNNTKDSATGLDDISYSMIQNCPNEGKSIFLEILNSIWLSGDIPENWKEIIVVPLPKPGKPKGLVSSQRPIALSSNLLKIFEHLIKNRMVHFIEKELLLPHFMAGFRKGKATADNIIQLISDIQLATSSRNHVICASFDIQGAFNYVNIPRLVDKCVEFGLPKSVVQVINNLLSERKIRIKYKNNITAPRSIFLGLPQGSVISPLLWLIYTADLKSKISKFSKVLMYADDFLMYTVCREINIGMSTLEKDNTALSEWLDDCHLSLSSAKSNFIIFSNSKVKNNHNKLKYNNEFINRVTFTKVLGIIIDENLTWSKQLDKVYLACHKALNIIKATSRVWWGADPNTAILLYKSLIRSKIEYCSFIFASACNTSWKKIESIQNTAIRVILGAFKSSPTHCLQVESALPPLYIRSQRSADRYMLKLITIRNHPLLTTLFLLHRHANIPTPYFRSHKIPLLVNSINRLSTLFPSIRKELRLPCYMLPFQTILTNINVTEVEISKEDRDIPNLATAKSREIMDNHINSIKIYTDGSKTNIGVGAAFYVEDDNHYGKFKLPREASIFTAEALALSKALTYVYDSEEKDFIILSDSKSVLTALKGNLIKPNVNWILLQIKEKVKNCIEEEKNITFCWIPAHCNIKGNEKADLAAKSAIFEGEETDIKLPYTDILKVTNELHINDWKSHFNSIKESNQQRRIEAGYEASSWYDKVLLEFPKNPLVPWFKGKLKSRNFYSIINRLRIGHNSSPSHLYRLGIKTDKGCSCGYFDMCPQHMIFECPIAWEARAELTLELSQLGFGPPKEESWSLTQILKSKLLEAYSKLVKFILRSGMPI